MGHRSVSQNEAEGSSSTLGPPLGAHETGPSAAFQSGHHARTLITALVCSQCVLFLVIVGVALTIYGAAPAHTLPMASIAVVLALLSAFGVGTAVLVGRCLTESHTSSRATCVIPENQASESASNTAQQVSLFESAGVQTIELDVIEPNWSDALWEWLSDLDKASRVSQYEAVQQWVMSGEPELCSSFVARETPTSSRWVLLRCVVSARNAVGSTERVQLTTVDISPFASTELAPKDDLDRASEAARLRSEFLANMSHEIRTPMTAIIGYADVLSDPTLTSCDSLDAIRTIKRNGEHLLTLIDDILDLTKIEARKMKVERISLSPAWVVCDVLALMKVRAQARDIALGAEWCGEIPAQIVTDPHRLKQILVNLVSNAIKFTEHGSVRVRVSVKREHNKDMLCIDVIDTGIGMSVEQMSALFGEYHQADASTARKYGGTGLGLKISKHLAEMLGGSIRVASAVGAGSTFSLAVETGSLVGVMMVDMNDGYDDVEDPAPNVADHTGKLSHVRVLLAEDGPDNQRLIAFFLRRAGATVDIAENGSAAVQMLQSHPKKYQLVLMDMQMPIIDGLVATRTLREAGCTLPIIALSAYVTAESRQECLDAGCDGWLSKPIVCETLIDTCVRFAAMRAQEPEMRAA